MVDITYLRASLIWAPPLVQWPGLMPNADQRELSKFSFYWQQINGPGYGFGREVLVPSGTQWTVTVVGPTCQDSWTPDAFTVPGAGQQNLNILLPLK